MIEIKVTDDNKGSIKFDGDDPEAIAKTAATTIIMLMSMARNNHKKYFGFYEEYQKQMSLRNLWTAWALAHANNGML